MTSEQIAKKVYKKFSFLEGNQHIAGEFALICIVRLINDFNVKSVLEIGLGIGCITETVLTFSKDVIYLGTEANEFCLEALQVNITNYDSLQIYNDLSEIPLGVTNDFIIVDGSDVSFSLIKRMCHKKTIIFIEGGRALQVNDLKKLFPRAMHVEMISDYKCPDYGPFSNKNWSNGGQLIFPYPTVKMKIYYLKEKIATYWKRKKRIRK